MTNPDLDEQPIQLHIEEINDEQLTEDDIPVWYFPSNVFYKKLGVHFILEKHKLLPDPNMIGLYEKLADEILDPKEAFELKKEELDIKSE